MSRSFAMLQVDVFSDKPLAGNPLAVFPDAEGLSDSEMQKIAAEMNLSETTFVLPADAPKADYRVRIFTPRGELPFAGHPTLGTAHALLEGEHRYVSGHDGVLRQQTLAGIQSIAIEGANTMDRRLVMTVPTPRFGDSPDPLTIAKALRIPQGALLGRPRTVDVGVSWHIAELDALSTIANLDPDMDAITRLHQETGSSLTLFCDDAANPSCEVRVRTFAPAVGIPEDPVCGSGNACVAAFRAARAGSNLPLAYCAEQGVEMGRAGRVSVEVSTKAPGSENELSVRVGGGARTVLEGTLLLD